MFMIEIPTLNGYTFYIQPSAIVSVAPRVNPGLGDDECGSVLTLSNGVHVETHRSVETIVKLIEMC